MCSLKYSRAHVITMTSDPTCRTQADKASDSVSAHWQPVTLRAACPAQVRKQVVLDVKRTEKRLPFYRGDRDSNPNVAGLERILLSYAWANPETGYCQVIP